MQKGQSSIFCKSKKQYGLGVTGEETEVLDLFLSKHQEMFWFVDF